MSITEEQKSEYKRAFKQTLKYWIGTQIQEGKSSEEVDALYKTESVRELLKSWTFRSLGVKMVKDIKVVICGV